MQKLFTTLCKEGCLAEESDCKKVHWTKTIPHSLGQLPQTTCLTCGSGAFKRVCRSSSMLLITQWTPFGNRVMHTTRHQKARNRSPVHISLFGIAKKGVFYFQCLIFTIRSWSMVASNPTQSTDSNSSNLCFIRNTLVSSDLIFDFFNLFS